MKTLAIITGERRLFCPFKIYCINQDLQILICRCTFARRLIRKMNKLQVCGYIARGDMRLPFKRYDGSGVFCLKVPMLIKKLIKSGSAGAQSVAVVSSGEEGIGTLFEGIAGIFRDFYIISPDYEFAAQQAQRLICEYGIAAQTDEPGDMCDVEIFTGTDSCGLGRCALNYGTQYEINHSYNLPVKVDSRAFSEALLTNGLITEDELKKLSISIGGIAL